MKPAKSADEQGMTLIELVIVIVVVAVLASFVSHIVYYEVETFYVVTNRKEGVQNARFATQLMSRDLRQIMTPDSIINATADSIKFKDINGELMTYLYHNSQLLRNGDLLLDGTTMFGFSFADDDGSAMTFPVTDPTRIRTVSFSLTANTAGQPVTTQVSVTPRNF